MDTTLIGRYRDHKKDQMTLSMGVTHYNSPDIFFSSTSIKKKNHYIYFWVLNDKNDNFFSSLSLNNVIETPRRIHAATKYKIDAPSSNAQLLSWIK